MYRKDMDKYKQKFRDLRKENNLEEIRIKIEEIIQEIYEHGYSDGLEEREHEQEKEPIPWEDLD